ncbi:MAG: thiamine pyrophosphate-binding protein [Spirochaetia bacterium]|jgi:3D-(3,5/4)-trihydroxycyclohexane-1,2-dione acylhydrolase (decyclizing)|nr:thiamine pyrophosphate-binding protein [Spirochaetia bacterium]
MEYKEIEKARIERANILAECGGLDAALAANRIPLYVDATLSELLILGLLRQNVTTYFTVFGHGSTDIGEVLRIYEKAGLVRVLGLRNEIEASHVATALNWITHEKAAVVTSIGPGAFQALAASLVPASDGIGVWYLFGDETTEDEGYNMQQIPKNREFLFPQVLQTMGSAYSLQDPWSLSTALRRGHARVDHPFRPGPFYVSMPMNVQSRMLRAFNLRELQCGEISCIGAAIGDYEKAVAWIRDSRSAVIKIGAGAKGAKEEILQLAELADGVCVYTPIAGGIVPYKHPRCMGVGGSKGSICGNYAMEKADLLIAIGTRAVCQSDSSRTGYPNVRKVININADLDDALHYQDSLALMGDARLTLKELIGALKRASEEASKEAPKEALREAPKDAYAQANAESSDWLSACVAKKSEWEAFKQLRFDNPTLEDSFWRRRVLTQPAAIKIALDWSADKEVINIFDAGDVQANGFQIASDEWSGKTITDSGASYMGFAVSAILASAANPDCPYILAFSGDGSFTMNPQILIDGVEHGARGCILIFDNNRMAAISGLQMAQYGNEFATWHEKPIDYLAWAKSVPGVMAISGGYSPEELRTALDKAFDYKGLSLIHIPVYYGTNPFGSMGVYGRWNVGNWVEETQKLRHKIGL